MTKVQSKIKIVYSMRKWSFKYVAWRLTTAYPGGWRYAMRHPIELVKDTYKYLAWCQEIDRYVRK